MLGRTTGRTDSHGLAISWAVIVAVCAAARWVGQRVDTADNELSRRQWELMCEALGLDDLAAAADAADEPAILLAGRRARTRPARAGGLMSCSTLSPVG